jgi:F0F1-type ATP synthase membrane subunit b/b'
MKDITLSIPDKDYPFFIRLIKKLDFVKIKEPKQAKVSASKQKFRDELKQAVEELNMIKSGKLKGRPLQELIDEL